MGAAAFSSSCAKDFIRDRIDFEIIRGFQRDHYPDQHLAYLGLPGEALLDVLSWRQFIGRWTAVQVARTPDEADVADRLVHNAMMNRLERGFDLVRADIDDLLPDRQGPLRWPYQIVNLDYYGGLVNAGADGDSRRLEALRGLFSNQAGIAFVLFITLNLRDRDRGELDRLVAEEQESLQALDIDGASDLFAAHRELGHAGLLKVYLPLFLGSIANRHSLAFSPPILYRGTQQMIHFAIRCVPYTGGAGRQFRDGDRVALINLPLLVLHGQDDLRSLNLGQIRR